LSRATPQAHPLSRDRPTLGRQRRSKGLWLEVAVAVSFQTVTRGVRVNERNNVTQNSAVKKAVRARMAETGEKYTEARRKVLGEPGDYKSPPAPPLNLEFPPETFTAVIGAGGMTNLGLVMPSLTRMASEGHPVVIGSHEGNPTAWNLASPFDFLVAAGKIGADELAKRWGSGEETDRDHLVALLDGFEMTFVPGAISAAEWTALLQSSSDGKHAVLYVPDLQVDLPLSDWPPTEVRASVSDYDVMPAQLAGLKAVSRQAEAAVIGAYCAASYDRDSWRIVADIADDTIAIDCRPSDTDDSIYNTKLEFHSTWAEGKNPVKIERAQIDVGFDSWRVITMARGNGS
jgi:hypothetical protein